MEIVDENGNEQKSGPLQNHESKRVIAGVLGILFGSMGIHKFVLGYTKEGLIQLGLTSLVVVFLVL